MKKILVIGTSPRAKGNSDLLCDELIRGAAEAGKDIPDNCIAAGNPAKVIKDLPEPDGV